MNRFASTRSERRASQPWLPAQWRVGSIEDDGIRYGLTTHALIASTIAIAPAMVAIQSIAIRHGRGNPRVSRSIGLWDWCFGGGSGASRTSRGVAGGGGGESGSGGAWRSPSVSAAAVTVDVVVGAMRSVSSPPFV